MGLLWFQPVSTDLETAVLSEQAIGDRPLGSRLVLNWISTESWSIPRLQNLRTRGGIPQVYSNPGAAQLFLSLSHRHTDLSLILEVVYRLSVCSRLAGYRAYYLYWVLCLIVACLVIRSDNKPCANFYAFFFSGSVISTLLSNITRACRGSLLDTWFSSPSNSIYKHFPTAGVLDLFSSMWLQCISPGAVSQT